MAMAPRSPQRSNLVRPILLRAGAMPDARWREIWIRHFSGALLLAES